MRDDENPFRNTLPAVTSPESMARVLWSKYTEWCEQFANAMLTVVRDGAGDPIPVDQVDLDTIAEHDRKLYEALKKRAAELGIAEDVLERTRP